jgi:hypothetical protein
MSGAYLHVARLALAAFDASVSFHQANQRIAELNRSFPSLRDMLLTRPYANARVPIRRSDWRHGADHRLRRELCKR